MNCVKKSLVKRETKGEVKVLGKIETILLLIFGFFVSV